MPNGSELTNQLEFEERIKSIPPEERIIFIAKQTYTLTTKFDSMNKKFTDLDTKLDNITTVSYTHLTLPTKRIV